MLLSVSCGTDSWITVCGRSWRDIKPNTSTSSDCDEETPPENEGTHQRGGSWLTASPRWSTGWMLCWSGGRSDWFPLMRLHQTLHSVDEPPSWTSSLREFVSGGVSSSDHMLVGRRVKSTLTLREPQQGQVQYWGDLLKSKQMSRDVETWKVS